MTWQAVYKYNGFNLDVKDIDFSTEKLSAVVSKFKIPINWEC